MLAVETEESVSLEKVAESPGEKNSQFQTLQLRFVLPRMIPAFFRRRHFYDWDQYLSIGYGSTVIAIRMDYARRGYVFQRRTVQMDRKQ